MWQSLRISHLVLRISLAIVFVWMGLDKFFHPDYWLNSHIPGALVHLLGLVHISPDATAYGLGAIEFLVGLSLAINIFVDFFALLALLLVICITLFYGFNEAAIRNLSLIGGLLSLMFWPSRNFRSY